MCRMDIDKSKIDNSFFEKKHKPVKLFPIIASLILKLFSGMIISRSSTT